MTSFNFRLQADADAELIEAAARSSAMTKSEFARIAVIGAAEATVREARSRLAALATDSGSPDKDHQ